MSGVVADPAVYEWLCSLEEQLGSLRAQNMENRMRIGQLEAEIVLLRREDEGCMQGLQRLSDHVRSMFGKAGQCLR